MDDEQSTPQAPDAPRLDALFTPESNNNECCPEKFDLDMPESKLHKQARFVKRRCANKNQPSQRQNGSNRRHSEHPWSHKKGMIMQSVQMSEEQQKEEERYDRYDNFVGLFYNVYNEAYKIMFGQHALLADMKKDINVIHAFALYDEQKPIEDWHAYLVPCTEGPVRVDTMNLALSAIQRHDLYVQACKPEKQEINQKMESVPEMDDS